MSSLKSYFESDFNTQREQWEKSLLAELKLQEIGNKSTKKMASGMSWPTLSLDANITVQLAPAHDWKKASTTYVCLAKNEIRTIVEEDLKAGVRNFFIFDSALSPEKWTEFEQVLNSCPDKNELEVFIIGEVTYESSFFKVVKTVISGKLAHDQGGHSVQELGFMARNLIQNINGSDDIYLGVYVDSHFFHSIAKLRAARLLALKILEEEGKSNKLRVVALSSYSGWSLFERYSNMLRNETAVAAAYIGGADHIQSSGYNALIEIEAEAPLTDEHNERSRRMARNTSHVLALESMLGIVGDAAFGSYHLENLTQALCEESWKMMQRLLQGEDISSEILQIQHERLKMIKNRKTVMSGINDYPDAKEELHLTLKAPSFFRPARVFEELRLKMNEIKKPEVYLALYGDYSALNSRLNYVKNYFELLGLRVHESGHSEMDLTRFKKNLNARQEEIIVLCAADEHYPLLNDAASLIRAPHKYIAGKVEFSTFKNLFAGQNVYEVLENLVNSLAGRKS